MVINLKVKLFDESDETDLQNAINSFLNGGNYDIIDIRYQVAISMTIPKILKGLDTDQIESTVTSAFPEEEKPAPKVEVTKEEQETLEQLMKKLGL